MNSKGTDCCSDVMLFGFEPSRCNFHYIHIRKSRPLGTPGSKLPKHRLRVRLISDFALELRRDFVSCGHSRFDAVDAPLGEPMLDFAHEAFADAALSMGPFAL